MPRLRRLNPDAGSLQLANSLRRSQDHILHPSTVENTTYPALLKAKLEQVGKTENLPTVVKRKPLRCDRVDLVSAMERDS